jgi:RecA/RadA recombinase
MPTPLSEALATLRRRHGEAVIRSGDALGGIDAWPTGLPVLDHRLTPGGLPVGRVSSWPPPPGASGRLTLLQALVAAASRERTAVYLDLVGSLDPGFLADLGSRPRLSCWWSGRPRVAGGRGSPWPGAW